MNKEEKQYLRSILFRHLDGIALCNPISSLNKSGITQYIIDNPIFNIQNISNKFQNNIGYLNITLRLLASQGWIKITKAKDGINIYYEITNKGQKCIELSDIYNKFSNFTLKLINIDKYLFNSKSPQIEKEFQELINTYISFSNQFNNEDTPSWEISKHIEGILIGPVLVALEMSKFFNINTNNNFIDIESIKCEMPILNHALNMMRHLQWINNENIFSKKGLFFLKRATAYGVTVSYLPTFQKVPELLFGNPNILWKRNSNGLESHVNRRMNVWGSGGAHSLYFKKIDEIITEIFNEPLNNQPIGIADMGCGDGTMLIHLYNVIKNNTIRGRNLNEYPLKVIGADFNKAARLASSINLKDADIKHSILHGDISNPTDYADNLHKQFNLKLNDMLSVRSFLDHNRIYATPKKQFNSNKCNSTGSFSFRGRWIPNKELQQNLIEHFSDWAQYISKYGLLILELHTISPILTSNNLGKTVATAYDATHGYSDQYIIEAEIMLNAAKEAGLIPVEKYSARFPNNKIPTISINLFKSNL